MDDTVGQTPLFPLPQGSLLPGELLPLRIFEPRYRAMLEDVRQGDRMIAVATLMPGWETDYHGLPPVAAVVGLGRLVKDKLNQDGTSEIVLHGIGRATITGEVSGRPFRRVSVRPRPDTDGHPAEAFRLRRGLLLGLAAAVRPAHLDYDVFADFRPGKLVDRIAGALPLRPEARVAILQAVDIEQRVDVLLGLLRDARHRQALVTAIPALRSFAIGLEA